MKAIGLKKLDRSMIIWENSVAFLVYQKIFIQEQLWISSNLGRQLPDSCRAG